MKDGLDKADGIERNHVPVPETLEEKLRRDLDAWLEAKAAIARAMRR